MSYDPAPTIAQRKIARLDERIAELQRKREEAVRERFAELQAERVRRGEH